MPLACRLAAVSRSIGPGKLVFRDGEFAAGNAAPNEYVALKGITAPLVGLQNECGTVGLPMNLIDAFNEFQAG